MGLDGIHSKAPRELVEELAEPLSIVYHQSWLTRMVLDEWKLASVTPIHKKGQKKDPKDYRPVSPALVLCKFREQIILNVLKRYMQDNQMIRPSHHGERLVLHDQPDLLL
ncbi:RNA-directed DNA polymerase from mobile element jockey [Willisornis vidua]|uniref:RNA-directed DNA polymerase from mobile element jockey n=1 Tax=Willisornis vidua TaxID=1566151 RepID=A0ABQ9DRL3_9PASS|nr:RNA-directed DNA polymerase from mobile element jockey [Willisornis vidua]